MTNVVERRGVIPTIELHHRLRIARELTGLDGQTFAQMLGLSNTGFYNAESGKSRPRELTLRAWADATGVDLQWLKTGVEPEATDQKVGGSNPSGRATRSASASAREQPPSPALGMIVLAGLITAHVEQVNAR